MLGYESEFGYEEALNLINAMKFTEKCTGYIATGIMLNERNDPKIFEPVVHSIKMDLTSGNEVCECLALATLANIGGLELSKELGETVMKKAFGEIRSSLQVRKRAVICLLSFFRRNHALYNQETWLRAFKEMLNETNFGFLLSATALIHFTI